MLTRWVAFLLAALVPSSAMAEPPERESAAVRSLALAVQQVATSAEQYIGEVRAQLAARDAEIAESSRSLAGALTETRSVNAWWAGCVAKPACVDWANGK